MIGRKERRRPGSGSATIGWIGRVAWWAVWGYFGVVIALSALLWGAGDVWWGGTLLLFGPRWPLLLPLGILVPLSVAYCQRSLPWLLIAGTLVLVGFMGIAFPWRKLTEMGPGETQSTLRLITYNCGGGIETRDVIEFADALRPDVLALNEWHGSRPLPSRLTDGHHVARAGGNVIISRYPVSHIKSLRSEQLKRWEQRAVRCQIQTPVGEVQVVSLHLETPRHGLTELRYRRWEGLNEMRRNTAKRRLESELASRFAQEFSGPSIVLGDFNMPRESRIYRKFWSGWQNAFSHAGWGLGHTKQTRHFGVRIDHILVSSHWRIASARVGPGLGGDHRPVIAKIVLRNR